LLLNDRSKLDRRFNIWNNFNCGFRFGPRVPNSIRPLLTNLPWPKGIHVAGHLKVAAFFRFDHFVQIMTATTCRTNRELGRPADFGCSPFMASRRPFRVDHITATGILNKIRYDIFIYSIKNVCILFEKKNRVLTIYTVSMLEVTC